MESDKSGPTAHDRRVTTDRRTQRRYRFDDRRTGFDRRKPSPVLGTIRDRGWILLGILALLNLLSLMDGLLTYREVTLGIATEGNPLLASLFEAHPAIALAFKVFVVAMVSAIIWARRRVRIMLVIAIVACGIYIAVIAYHLGSLTGFRLL